MFATTPPNLLPFCLSWREALTSNIVSLLSFQSVHAELRSFETLLARANDIRNNRIMEMLDRISDVKLSALPEDDDPWTVRSFMERCVTKVIEGATEMQSLSISVLDAVHDFCDILMEDFDKLRACYSTHEEEQDKEKG